MPRGYSTHPEETAETLLAFEEVTGETLFAMRATLRLIDIANIYKVHMNRVVKACEKLKVPRKYERAERKVVAVIPSEKHERAGKRKCLCCGNQFYSPDTRRVQMCSNCKRWGATGLSEHYAATTF